MSYYEYFADYLAKADALAGKYQAKYRIASIIIYCLSALAVVVASSQLLFHLSHFVSLIKIFAMITILIFEKRNDWHKRWLNYRFFTERLRCGMYLAIFSEQDSINHRQNISYLTITDSWCLNLYKSIWKKRPASQALTDLDLELLKSKLDELWLADQLVFHRNKRKRV